MKVEEVLDYFGGTKEAANAIGLKRGSFYQWRARKYIPIIEQIEFERITKKKLKVDWDEYYQACLDRHKAKYRKK